MSPSANKPAEHPAKAIMAKRWEERRAEARARRISQLESGDPSRVTLEAAAQVAGVADNSSASVQAPTTQSGIRLRPESDEAAAVLAAEGGSASLAKPTEALPASAAESSAVAKPHWLRDSRRAMLMVALVSSSLLLALLYFGGFLD